MSKADESADPFRAEVSTELKALEVDLLWTEKAHFETATVYARLHLWLGSVATVAAAVAAASVVGNAAPVISGLAAVLASIASGITTFLKPQDAQQRHSVTGRRLGALRVTVRQAVNLDLHPERPEDPEAWRTVARDFAKRKADIDADAPNTSNRAFRAARKKIEAGHFEHGGH